MAARCSHHCRQCGAHFSSLAGYDAHVDVGDRRRRPPVCVDPDDVPALVVLTEAGVCLGRTAERVEGVTVWTVGKDLERARGALRAYATPQKALWADELEEARA
jgi:hypothetical protein